MNYLRDKHRDKERKENKEHKEHRDKEKHHSSKSSHHDRHKDREKKVTENGVEHAIKAEPVVAIKNEMKDPLDISDYAAFSESNVNRANNMQPKMMQANGIRDCYVNVSQMSETSSCDYSMSQFRADESAFSIKAEINDDSRGIGDYAGNDTIESQDDDDDDVPIAQRKKIKRELVVDDDEDDMPLTARKKPKTEKKEKKIKREISDVEEDDYDKPKKKKIKKEKVTFSK